MNYQVTTKSLLAGTTMLLLGFMLFANTVQAQTAPTSCTGADFKSRLCPATTTYTSCSGINYDTWESVRKATCSLSEKDITQTETKTNLLRRLEFVKLSLDVSYFEEKMLGQLGADGNRVGGLQAALVSISPANRKTEIENNFNLYRNIRAAGKIITDQVAALPPTLIAEKTAAQAKLVTIGKKLYAAVKRFDSITLTEQSCSTVANATWVTASSFTQDVNVASALMSALSTTPSDEQVLTYLSSPLSTNEQSLDFTGAFTSENYGEQLASTLGTLPLAGDACKFVCNDAYTYVGGVCQENFCTGTTPVTGIVSGNDKFIRNNTLKSWAEILFNYAPSLTSYSSASAYFGMYVGPYEHDTSAEYSTRNVSFRINTDSGVYDGNLGNQTITATNSPDDFIDPAGMKYIRFNPGNVSWHTVSGETFEVMNTGDSPMRIKSHSAVQLTGDESVSFWYRPDLTYTPVKGRTFGLLWQYVDWSRRVGVVYYPAGGCLPVKSFAIRMIVSDVMGSANEHAGGNSPCYPVEDKWHQITYTLSRGASDVTLKGYVDGNEITFPDTTIANIATATGEWHIGHYVGSTPTSHYFGKGDIGTTYFYKRTLPAEEVRNRYLSNPQRDLSFVPALNACEYTCQDGYTKNGAGVCEADGVCGGTPPTFTETLEQGSGTYSSTLTPPHTSWTLVAGTPQACEFSCTGGAVFNVTTNQCELTCSGATPTGTLTQKGITTSVDQLAWTYKTDDLETVDVNEALLPLNACEWVCPVNSIQNGSSCETRIGCVGSVPADGQIVDGGVYYGDVAPTNTSWNYNPNRNTLVACQWSCGSGFIWDGNQCVNSFACLGTDPSVGNGLVKSVNQTNAETPKTWTLVDSSATLNECEWQCVDTHYGPANDGSSRCVSRPLIFTNPNVDGKIVVQVGGGSGNEIGNAFCLLNKWHQGTLDKTSGPSGNITITSSPDNTNTYTTFLNSEWISLTTTGVDAHLLDSITCN